MKILALAAFASALGLPTHAQQLNPPREEARAAKAVAAAPAAPEARTPREKARLAKAANKEARCPTPKPKKAAAT